jgi:hypothetical protein
MLFVTSQFYALGKQLGMAQAARSVHLQLQSPDRDSLPCVRTIHRLNAIETVKMRLDAGATCIGKCRSRAFHAALNQDECDVWVAIDDDVEASMPTLRWMLEAVRDTDGIVVVPYLVRTGKTDAVPTACVTFETNERQCPRTLKNGGKVVRAVHGGFGLVAMSKHAMVEIVAGNPGLAFQDDDGVIKPALFLEELKAGRWYSEDLSFFHRVPSNVTIEAVVTGETSHCGEGLKLENVWAYLDRTPTERAIEPCPITTGRPSR